VINLGTLLFKVNFWPK